jgi:hypothetical protein
VFRTMYIRYRYADRKDMQSKRLYNWIVALARRLQLHHTKSICRYKRGV